MELKDLINSHAYGYNLSGLYEYNRISSISTIFIEFESPQLYLTCLIKVPINQRFQLWNFIKKIIIFFKFKIIEGNFLFNFFEINNF
ncbi:hypothetical protein MBBTH_10900 [Methanobrevibacter thaueri]|uniref:Uncharacterized protein n=1 Tax=Methanobrevibacter thaueri TaxID=190975 RepID=A0A315XNS5_9EURY|nr:hypothetical protein MBBTH_10900 [Methanobrevibacter thaueri]